MRWMKKKVLFLNKIECLLLLFFNGKLIKHERYSKLSCVYLAINYLCLSSDRLFSCRFTSNFNSFSKIQHLILPLEFSYDYCKKSYTLTACFSISFWSSIHNKWSRKLVKTTVILGGRYFSVTLSLLCNTMYPCFYNM